MSVTSIEETSGSPLNGYTGEPVDYSSLTFEATYEDGTTGSVTPTSCTPSVWGEAGTETITFSFEGTDVTCEVVGEAIAPTPAVLTGISVSGTPTGTQYLGYRPDLTGLTVTASYDDESSSDITNSPDLTFSWTYQDNTETFSYYGQAGTHQFISNAPTIKICYGGFETSAVEMPTLHYNGVAGLEFRAKDGETESWDDADVVTNLDNYGCNDYAVVGGSTEPLVDGFDIAGYDTRIYIVHNVADYATDMNKSSYTDSLWRNNDVFLQDNPVSRTVDGVTYEGELVTTEFSSTAGVQNVTWVVNDGDEGEWTLSLPVTVSEPTVTGVTLSGMPTGTQQTGSAPDFTGVTINYQLNNGSVSKSGNEGIIDSTSNKNLATLSGSGLTNGVWTVWPPANAEDYEVTLTVDGSNSGYWADQGIEVATPAPTGTKDFTPPIQVTSISITGTLTGTNVEGEWSDYTGLTANFGLSNGQTLSRSLTDSIYPDEIVLESSAGFDNEYKWATGSAGTQTVTLTCIPEATWWADEGYEVADPAPSASIQVTVQAPL